MAKNQGKSNYKSQPFVKLFPRELLGLRNYIRIDNTFYMYLVLKLEDPFRDRPVTVVPKEFALKWGMPEKSVYKAIAKLKELGIIQIKSGKIVLEWVDVGELTSRFSDPRTKTENSQGGENLLKLEKNFSNQRKNSQTRENRGLKPLSDIVPEVPQTIQTIQTNQTKRLVEKNSSQIGESEAKEVVLDLDRVAGSESNLSALEKDRNEENVSERVVQTKQKIVSSSQKQRDSIPNDLIARLQQCNIAVDNQLRSAIAKHHISQAYGACTHVENSWHSINSPRGVFLHQLPKQPVEKLGCRHDAELLEKVKAMNSAIETEREQPEYFEKSQSAFAQIKEKLSKVNSRGNT